ncbi:MAG TPA: sensor domain-containing diguanylate cyclase [Longimicrobiales bacterium]
MDGSPTANEPRPTAPEQRYAALLEVSRILETNVGPALFFPALYERIRGALPSTAFLAGLHDGSGPIHPVFRAGETEGCLAYAVEVLDRLRAGECPIGGGPDAARLAAPISRDGRLLGCLAAERVGGEFAPEDATFLGAIGPIAAAAIDGAWLAVVARRRGDEIERLDAAARDLGASLELDEVVQRVADHANALVEKPIVVWLVENERARVAARAGGALVRLGEERKLTPSDEARIGRSGQTLREALDIVDHDERSIAIGLAMGEAGAVPRDPTLGDTISVPLMLGQRLVGFLAVGPWADDAPDREKLRLLLRMAPYAAAAVENARLHAELRELSLTDPLLQLPNRRQLDLFLEREFAAATRGRALCFVLFDLDHFKAYNDTYGHREGDDALILFARVLREETRSMNLAARYGGEEFAAVLSGTGKAGGHMHAERVRRRVLQETNGRLTVSAGVAEYRPGMRSPIDLVVAADQALYRAKTGGRNRVCVAED